MASKDYNEQNIIKLYDYISEEKRLKTYKFWIFPDDVKCNKNKMAEAGFIFTGNRNAKDIATCFFCDKSLDGWEEDDDPWKEHLSHAEKCPFAALQKPQDELTLTDFFQLKSQYMQKIAKSIIEEKFENLENVSNLKLLMKLLENNS